MKAYLIIICVLCVSLNIAFMVLCIIRAVRYVKKHKKETADVKTPEITTVTLALPPAPSLPARTIRDYEAVYSSRPRQDFSALLLDEEFRSKLFNNIQWEIINDSYKFDSTQLSEDFQKSITERFNSVNNKMTSEKIRNILNKTIYQDVMEHKVIKKWILDQKRANRGLSMYLALKNMRKEDLPPEQLLYIDMIKACSDTLAEMNKPKP